MKQHLSVLLVEDSPYAADLNVRYLRKSGMDFDYQIVSSGSEMRLVLAAKAWDIILSDDHMPGFGLLQALNERNLQAATVPFVIVSELVSEETLAQAYANHADGFVPKKNLPELASVVSRLLGGGQMSTSDSP